MSLSSSRTASFCHPSHHPNYKRFLYNVICTGISTLLNTLTFFIMSLIQCHYIYACCIWYRDFNKVLKTQLQTTQNKLIRFVSNRESRAHISKEHFELLNWLPVNSRVDHLTLCHVFQMRNGISPQYMR